MAGRSPGRRAAEWMFTVPRFFLTPPERPTKIVFIIAVGKFGCALQALVILLREPTRSRSCKISFFFYFLQVLVGFPAMGFLGLFLAKTANFHSSVSLSVIGKSERNTYHFTSYTRGKESYFTSSTASATGLSGFACSGK